MSRPRFESDERWNDDRRKVKPHVKIHLSVAGHPRTQAIWPDNDLFACWNRILHAGSRQGSAHTADVIYVNERQALELAGKTRIDAALRLIRRVADHEDWTLVLDPRSARRWPDVGRTSAGRSPDVQRMLAERPPDFLAIHVRNLADKQGTPPRKPRSDSADSAVLPTPHSSKNTSPFPSSAESEVEAILRRDVESWFEATLLPLFPTDRPAKAKKAILKLLPDPELRQRIVDDVELRKRSRKWREGYAPALHNYLGERGWEAPLPLDPEQSPREAGDPVRKNGTPMNGARVWVTAKGKRITVGKEQFVHWITDQELAAGAFEGHQLGNGAIALRAGGHWEKGHG